MKLLKHDPPPHQAAPDFADVPYGHQNDRQKFDFWHPAVSLDSPAPVLIFFHGGGFALGHKYFAKLLREMRLLGAATVATNYSLTKRRGTTIVDSMKDGERVVNFIRSKAKDWNIDPDRIALMGKSSGGTIALRQGLSDSRIKGVATYNTPTSLDPTWLVDEMGARSINDYRILYMMLTDEIRLKGLKSAKIQNIISTYSPFDLVHDKGPPLYLEYRSARLHAKLRWFAALHNARYGELMQAKCLNVGMPCQWSSDNTPAPCSPLEFMCEALDVDYRPEPLQNPPSN